MGIQLRYKPNLSSDSLRVDCTMLAQVGRMDFYETPGGRLILRWSDEPTDYIASHDDYKHKYRALIKLLARMYSEGKL